MTEAQKKWVDALRSGEYKQGIGHLSNAAGEFCCLGVACEVYRKETGEGEWKYNGAEFSIPGAASAGGWLNDSPVAKWLDVAMPLQNRLSELNDEGRSFTEIADYLEKVL